MQDLTLKKIIDNNINVSILNIYPQQKQIRNYLSNLQMWCYPDGIKIYNQNIQILNDKNPEFSFKTSALQQFKDELFVSDQIAKKDLLYHFILTDRDLKRRYCTCLTFHQRIFIEDDDKQNIKITQKYSKTFPKCSVKKIATNPLKLDNDSYLVYIPKCFIIISQSPYFELQKQFLKTIYKTIILKKLLNSKCRQLKLSNEQYANLNLLSMKYGLPKAQKIFDEQYSINKKKISKKTQNKPSIIIKQTYLLEFYISLSYLFKNSNKLKIIQFIDEEQNTKFHYATQFQCFYPPDLNIVNILKKISLQHLLKILKNIILQRQILVFSKRPQFIIQFFQSIFFLIRPYVWENIYIPFLPFHLWKSIDAIGSYIIGMSKIHLDYILQHGSLQNKIIIDLDQMIIIEEGQKNLDFPKQIKNWLIQQIKKLDLNRKQIRMQKNQIRQKRWLKTIIKLKIIFFNFLIMFLNNFRQFINDVQKNQRQFQFNNQQYVKIFPAQDQNIIKQLCKTMMFTRLCEIVLKLKRNLQSTQKQLSSLFVYCQNIIQQKYAKKQKSHTNYWNLLKDKDILQSLQNYQQYLVQKNQKLLDKKQFYYLQQYLLKYVKYLEFNNLQNMLHREGESKLKTFIEQLQQQNQLYFTNINQKKKNWRYLNQKNTLNINHQKIVDISAIFQLLAISRYNQFQEDQLDLGTKKISKQYDRCYSHKPFHQKLNRNT